MPSVLYVLIGKATTNNLTIETHVCSYCWQEVQERVWYGAAERVSHIYLLEIEYLVFPQKGK